VLCCQFWRCRHVTDVDVVVQSMAACRKGTNNKYEFKFDCVFPPQASQAEVFEEISQLVQVQATSCCLIVCLLILAFRLDSVPL